jgi:hypothetical protein
MMHQPVDFPEAFDFFQFQHILMDLRGNGIDYVLHPFLQAWRGNYLRGWVEDWTGIEADKMHVGGGLYFDGYVRCHL